MREDVERLVNRFEGLAKQVSVLPVGEEQYVGMTFTPDIRMYIELDVNEVGVAVTLQVDVPVQSLDDLTPERVEQAIEDLKAIQRKASGVS